MFKWQLRETATPKNKIKWKTPAIIKRGLDEYLAMATCVSPFQLLSINLYLKGLSLPVSFTSVACRAVFGGI